MYVHSMDARNTFRVRCSQTDCSSSYNFKCKRHTYIYVQYIHIVHICKQACYSLVSLCVLTLSSTAYIVEGSRVLLSGVPFFLRFFLSFLFAHFFILFFLTHSISCITCSLWCVCFFFIMLVKLKAKSKIMCACAFVQILQIFVSA